MTPNNDLSEDELAGDDNTDKIKNEGGPELSTIAPQELSHLELQLTPTIPDSQGDTMAVIPQAESSSSMEVRLRQLEADLLKQEGYSVTLENQISELKRTNYDLEHNGRLASSAQGNHAEELRLRDDLSNARYQLEREQRLMKNYEELEADRLGFLNTSLQAEYAGLHSNIVDTSADICCLSMDDGLPEQRTDFKPLANNWATRIGGCSLDSLLDHCEAVQIPKKVILTSLLTAGIFELVLEKVFPAFLAADSPLLDQYRKHIETQSGWNALQQLDIVSIKSLLADKKVKERVLSERSEWLSTLTLLNLSCFLPPESRDITHRLSHEEPKTETMGNLTSTLRYALKFKMELMLSVKRLKYLFFKPGTPFDAGKMELVKYQAGDTAILGQEVKICLMPALFTISEAGSKTGLTGDREESGLRANYSEALTEVTDEGTESLVLVEKAIVFL